ncbi:MAG: dihydroorotase [Crocinitomicaceae bacterium]
MNNTILLKGGIVVNEGQQIVQDILIKRGYFEKISNDITPDNNWEVVDLKGKLILPGCIDDQVHFREPGLTQKANIFTESRAAVAGGITSFMEMPNTVPNTLNQELLQDKYDIGAKQSLANYSFFMGASNENVEDVLKTNERDVCGVKIFMGSSTGNMLVDSEATLNNLFSKVPMLISTHCEDEETIRANITAAKEKFGEDVPMSEHPYIRSEDACYKSSSMAVRLAKKHGTRLHVLHISTAKELSLFDNTVPLEQKKITAEACIHHMWFSEEQYAEKGAYIKWNPAIKKATDRDAIFQGVLDNKIDVIATDHAPHTLEEKANSYFKAPSGGPLVQHALVAMLQKVKDGMISIEHVVEKMAHAPAILFKIEKRGYIREGYYADLVVVDPNKSITVTKENILYKCGWSPFEGVQFDHSIHSTYVNGNLVYSKGLIVDVTRGKRLLFNR